MAAFVEVNGFEIVGREGVREFNQWEQNMKLSNPCMKAGDEVVFRNSSGATYVMIAGSDGVEVPNKMLQMTCNILVEHGQGQDSCGDCQSVFAVNPAEKPDDYVFVDNTIRKQEVQSGGAGNMLVTITVVMQADSEAEPQFVPDKTFAEIESAVDHGTNVRVKINANGADAYIPLTNHVPGRFLIFASYDAGVMVQIMPDGAFAEMLK